MIKRITYLIASCILLNIFFILNPSTLFAHHYEYKNFSIYSDRQINADIEFVIDDAINRLKNSELYSESEEFSVYLCNDELRFAFFTRSTNAGGLVNFVLSPNIFIRESDVHSNELIPPKSWRYPMKDRPLSYFIAHEAVHSLQRGLNAFLPLNTPPEIIEGYADYIAKSPSSNLDMLLKNYSNDDPRMDPKNGLYDKFHLYIAILMERKGYTFHQILMEKPEIEIVLSKIETS